MSWKVLTAEYASRKAAAEASVTTWEYATGLLHSLTPQVDSGRRPAIKRLSAPSTRRDTHDFGFDAERRLRIIRQHVGKRGCAYETFIVWDKNKATAVTYDYDPKFKVASRIGVLRTKGGRPTTYTHRYAGGTVVSRYVYQGDVLTTIFVKPPGGREEAHRPRAAENHASSRSADLGSLLTKAGQRLVATIPAAVRRAAMRTKSPVWCCALVFDRSQPALPPELAIATVAERDAAKRGAATLWNCLAWDGFGAPVIADAALDKVCKTMNAHLDARAGAQVSALLVGVARQLNELPHASFGNVAEEFVVYAFDRDRPAKALVSSSLTKKQLASLT